MNKEGSINTVNFMTPGAGVLVLGRGHMSHIVEMHYFFQQIFFSTLPGIDQTNIVYSYDDQGRMYRNCKFHTSHYSEYVLSSTPIPWLIFIYSMMGLLIYKYELF